MTTNYRKFYEKDPKFYQTVLDKEDPTQDGHEFKMHIFKSDENAESFD